MKTNPALALAIALDRVLYLENLGWPPFPWQSAFLRSAAKRKCVNGTRQCGKSTIVSSVPAHKAKYSPKSLSIVVAPTKTQAKEDMIKANQFISLDRGYPKIIRNNDDEIELANGSRIIVVPATEASARGYSSPDIIILDEASRIPDEVYTSGIIPMLTDNAKCELIEISTPNGKSGFFYKAYHNATWERYEIRSPYTVDKNDPTRLAEYMPEERYRALKSSEGIYACYSPRHFDYVEQGANLIEMGMQMYLQEYCCEFVEPADAVFSYDDIANAFAKAGDIKPLDFDIGEAEGFDL